MLLGENWWDKAEGLQFVGVAERSSALPPRSCPFTTACDERGCNDIIIVPPVVFENLAEAAVNAACMSR